jgi:hypothetical protein
MTRRQKGRVWAQGVLGGHQGSGVGFRGHSEGVKGVLMAFLCGVLRAFEPIFGGEAICDG